MAGQALRKPRNESMNVKPRGGVRTRSKQQAMAYDKNAKKANAKASYGSKPKASVGMQNGMLKTSITPIAAHQRAGARAAEVNAPSVRETSGRRGGAAALPKSMPKPQAAVKAQPKLKHYYDFYLFIGVLMIFAIGLMMVYSSSQYTAIMDGESHTYYFFKQFVIGAAGIVFIILCSVMSGLCIKFLKKFAYPIFGVTLLLAGLTMILGFSSNGSTRWLRIAGVSIQTAELVKIGLILYMAKAISKYGFSVGRKEHAWKIIIVCLVTSVIIAKENLSSGIIVAGIAFVMFFVANKNWKWFVAIGILGLAALIFAKPLTAYIVEQLGIVNISDVPYRIRRVLAWACPELFPDDAYQTMQGLYAIGTGGLLGQDLGESIQKFGALPEAQNDMIFTIICEELGFIGASAIVFVYALIIVRLMDIADHAADLFSSMLCVGILAHISIQVILNIAVVTGTIPNTGVTLPFISYGGSAVLCTMAEMGIALAVSHEIYTEA